MKRIVRWAFTTILLLVLLAIVGITAWSIWAAFHWIVSLGSEVVASVFGASGAVVAAVVAVLIGQYRTKSREIAEAHRTRKVDIYSKFLDTFVKLFKDQKFAQKKTSENKLVEYLMDFTRDIVLWGSPEVIKAWAKFKEGDHSDLKQSVVGTDRIIRAFRADLGLSNWGLKEGELVLSLIKKEDQGKIMVDS